MRMKSKVFAALAKKYFNERDVRRKILISLRRKEDQEAFSYASGIELGKIRSWVAGNIELEKRAPKPPAPSKTKHLPVLSFYDEKKIEVWKKENCKKARLKTQIFPLLAKKYCEQPEKRGEILEALFRTTEIKLLAEKIGVPKAKITKYLTFAKAKKRIPEPPRPHENDSFLSPIITEEEEESVKKWFIKYGS